MLYSNDLECKSLIDILCYTFIGHLLYNCALEDHILFDLVPLRTVLWDYQMYIRGTSKIYDYWAFYMSQIRDF